MRTGIPYFMTNKAWYRYDQTKFRCYLTELGKSIPEVVASYEETYATHYDDDGNIVDY